MKQVISILSIFVSFYVFAGTLHAETTSLAPKSPMNISHAMDMAVRSNSFNYLTVQETAATDTIYEKTNESKPGKLKSPTTALVIALVPGAIVHGAGHFYAGKTGTAFGLFSAEIIGAGMAFLGVAVSNLPRDTGGERGSGGDVVWLLGLGLFVGSWMYDIIASPAVVENQNDKILGKKPFPDELNMELDKRDQQLKCLIVKHF